MIRKPESTLEHGYDTADVGSKQHPKQHAEHDTRPTDHEPLRQKYLEYTARRGTEGAQNGDVGTLVGDHHHQHGDDIEGRDADDQHQNDRHHRLLDTDGPKIIGVILRPIAQTKPTTEPSAELAIDCGGGQRIGQLHMQTESARIIQRECTDIVDVGQRERAVMIMQTHFKDSAHRELAQAWRGRAALLDAGYQQGHSIAADHTQQAGDHAAKNHAILARQQISEATLDHGRGRGRDAGL